PVIAANDGKVIKLGRNGQWGRYLELQDSNGNVYTYANLGSVPRLYPVPKPVAVSAAGVVKALATPGSSKPVSPKAPASAVSQNASAPGAGAGSQNAGAGSWGASARRAGGAGSGATPSNEPSLPLLRVPS